MAAEPTPTPTLNTAAAPTQNYAPPYLTMFQYQEKLHDELERLKSKVIEIKLDFLYGFMNNENDVVQQFETLKRTIASTTKILKKVQEHIKTFTALPTAAAAAEEHNEPILALDTPEILASTSEDRTTKAIQLRQAMYRYNAVEYIDHIGQKGLENAADRTVNYDVGVSPPGVTEVPKQEKLLCNNPTPINIMTDLLRLVQRQYTFSDSLIKHLV